MELGSATFVPSNLQAVASAPAPHLSTPAALRGALAATRPSTASLCSHSAGTALGLLLAGAVGGSRAARRKWAKRNSTARLVASVDAGIPVNQIEQPPADLREWRLRSAVQMKGDAWPTPKNDRLLKAARGEKVDRAPKWMMRQAGRYLPEYLEVLKTSDFFTVCKTPALAAELTLQPLRRYDTLDAMIIFSDILVIPVAMGMPCYMEPAKGPKFEFAIETPADLAKLNMKPDVPSTLGYVFDAIFWTRQRCNNDVPVIGFCGAPWTLMGYMVEGGAVSSFDRAKKWLYLYPEESKKLMAGLREIIVEYLVNQFDSGAPLLTIFDTNCGQVPPSVYEEFCVPDLKYIATEVKRQRPKALMSVFPKDGEIAWANDSDFDVVGTSWTTSPARARRDCPDKTLQGNLDPHLLYASPEEIMKRTDRMVKEFGVDKYIANLGHGMLPTHPVGGPSAFHEAVNKVSSEDAPTPTVAAPKAAASRGAPTMTLNLQDGASCSVPMTQAGATNMQKGLAEFVQMFKRKVEAVKPQKYDEFEFLWVQDTLSVEVFCNPNAFATIFDVKMFLTVKAGYIKVTSDIPLSSLQSDLEAYLAA
eukprot:CAMPEP_0183404362 /NCGR_PEP_ID=MMETSP0370-20130417/15115_1 /TAXON_ID=268820 /ORGANISM="Peridinium aciculiferum, Strain PAER-2" /LENGTH=588 /DNA_ID=CAMNT_0025586203 /DNA_START=79 /DNA_END=1845 /DNA_ORIENTATION=-